MQHTTGKEVGIDATRHSLITNKPSWFIQAKCGRERFCFMHKFKEGSGSDSYKGVYSATNKTGSNNWIKLEYIPINSNSGTFTAYYSLNGTSWTKIGGEAINFIEGFTPEYLCIRGEEPVIVSSIRFIYDNEVLFEKE